MNKEQKKVIIELKIAYKKTMIMALRAPLHIGCEIIDASRNAEDEAKIEARMEVGVSEQVIQYLERL